MTSDRVQRTQQLRRSEAGREVIGPRRWITRHRWNRTINGTRYAFVHYGNVIVTFQYRPGRRGMVWSRIHYYGRRK